MMPARAYAYSPRLFVAREAETERIRQVVEAWIDKQGTRAIRLTGPKGSGKSWLLCELGHQRSRDWNSSIVIRHLILGKDRPCDEQFCPRSFAIQCEKEPWNDFFKGWIWP